MITIHLKGFDMENDLSFDEWFDIFMDEVKKLNYCGPVDKYTFEPEFEDGRAPGKNRQNILLKK